MLHVDPDQSIAAVEVLRRPELAGAVAVLERFEAGRPVRLLGVRAEGISAWAASMGAGPLAGYTSGP